MPQDVLVLREACGYAIVPATCRAPMLNPLSRTDHRVITTVLYDAMLSQMLNLVVHRATCGVAG